MIEPLVAAGHHPAKTAVAGANFRCSLFEVRAAELYFVKGLSWTDLAM